MFGIRIQALRPRYRLALSVSSEHNHNLAVFIYCKLVPVYWLSMAVNTLNKTWLCKEDVYLKVTFWYDVKS